MEEENGFAYIGKLPGYNANINPSTSSSIDYTERLKNNLTVTTFQPTGYSININISTEAKTNGEKEEIEATGIALGSLTAGKAMFETGSKLGNNEKDTATALNIWTKLQKGAGFSGATVDGFNIISTNDSTINETISNEYAPNVLSDWKSMLGNKMNDFSKILTGAAGSITSLDSSQMLNLLDKKKELNTGNYQFFDFLSSGAIGLQTALPKIWKRSDYNNTSSFTIKLVSPSGNETDIDNFIIKPLTLLTLAASPVTYDGVSYGYPPIWRVESKGLIKMPLAVITAMVITRGGQDTLFNYKSQPTNIDVRLTVEPLISGFASPLINEGQFRIDNYNTNPESAPLDMLVASPGGIADAIQSAGKKVTYVNMKTLVLN